MRIDNLDLALLEVLAVSPRYHHDIASMIDRFPETVKFAFLSQDGLELRERLSGTKQFSDKTTVMKMLGRLH